MDLTEPKLTPRVHTVRRPTPMRRIQPLSGFNMIPMMGLCAVLIPMTLMAYAPDLATIQTVLPAL
jgi:hypothetical protein